MSIISREQALDELLSLDRQIRELQAKREELKQFVLTRRTNGQAGAAPSRKPLIQPQAPSNSTSRKNMAVEDLGSLFDSYPEKSRRYAERIFEEVFKFPGVSAKPRPNGRGIIFEPNFVSIEYLRSRSPGGLALSLGAPKRKYRNAPEELKRGRTESYSWIMVDSDELLERVVPLLKQTWDLRYER